MASEKRLTEKHYDGTGYFMKCSAQCENLGYCEECTELRKLVDRLGELEDMAEKVEYMHNFQLERSDIVDYVRKTHPIIRVLKGDCNGN